MRQTLRLGATLVALGLACVWPTAALAVGGEVVVQAPVEPDPERVAGAVPAWSPDASVEAPADSEALPDVSAPDPISDPDLSAYDPLLDEEFEVDLDERAVHDPFEGFNRGVFAVNEKLDDFAFDPITKGYQFLVPEPGRVAVFRFFQNLESPVLMTNQLLQLRLGAATLTLGRFVVNSTAGIGGIFDAAGHGAGWERVEADFGQTLARYGCPTGPYLIVPVLGPSTVRDFSGDIVDRLLDPLTYLVGPLQWWIPLGVSQGLSVREANIEALNALEASSVDFYSALRSAYVQSREAGIREAFGREESDAEDIAVLAQ
jgi:ABC-type transporter lipoprotein component MlaA